MNICIFFLKITIEVIQKKKERETNRNLYRKISFRQIDKREEREKASTRSSIFL
jgi:hypothetical protein